MFSNLSIKISWTLEPLLHKGLHKNLFCEILSQMTGSVLKLTARLEGGGSGVVQAVQLKVCWLWSQLWIQVLFPPVITWVAMHESVHFCGTGFFICGMGCGGKKSAAHGGWDLWRQIWERNIGTTRGKAVIVVFELLWCYSRVITAL